MITKLIRVLIIINILLSINSVVYAEVMSLRGEYYEKNGCIYLVGNLTEKELTADLEYYKERMSKRAIQVNAKLKRNQELKIETIKAQAMKDYLIAQSMPLREIADVLKETRVKQSVFIGDVKSYSTSKGGNATATGGTSKVGNVSAKTGAITNRANGGTGGQGGSATTSTINTNTNDNTNDNRNTNTNR